KGDVAACLQQPAAEIAAGRTGADHEYAHRSISVCCSGRSLATCLLVAQRWRRADRIEFTRDDGAQLVAQTRRAAGAKRVFELLLRLAPQFEPSTQPCSTRGGEVQLLAASIGNRAFDDDEAVTLQGQHGATERRSVHD